jgi:hypothetical protein
MGEEELVSGCILSRLGEEWEAGEGAGATEGMLSKLYEKGTSER